MPIVDRMAKDAVRLPPMHSVTGRFTFDSKIFANQLKTGKHRVVASLYGRQPSFFTAVQLSDLTATKALILSGEAIASTKISLVCEGCAKK